MTNSTASTNLTPEVRNAVSAAQWRELQRQAGCDLRVAMPGIIQSFDAVHQTATVQLAVMERVADPTGPVDVAVAPLLDVPAVLPRSGGYALTFPLKAGDECLVVFADFCIDTWWASGGTNNVQFELRRHDLSDAFCIPGPWSQPRVLSNYSTASVQLRSDDGSTVVDVVKGTVTVKSNTTTVVVTDGAVTVSSGGSALALVNDNFYQWFINTYMPAVRYVSSEPAPPADPETVVLKGQ